MNEKKLQLSNISGGAVEELFDEELEKVLFNINDINTEAESSREILIKIKVIPSKDRLTASTSVQVYSKLAPHCSANGSLFMGFEGNRPQAYANNPRQMTLSGDVV